MDVEPFALCPVHADPSRATTIWDGHDSVLAGPPKAVTECLQRAHRRRKIHVRWTALAWPELPPSHPHQFIIVLVEVIRNGTEFADLHNGAYFVPQGSRIDKSSDGICVLGPDGGHDVLSSQPIPRLN